MTGDLSLIQRWMCACKTPRSGRSLPRASRTPRILRKNTFTLTPRCTHQHGKLKRGRKNAQTLQRPQNRPAHGDYGGAPYAYWRGYLGVHPQHALHLAFWAHWARLGSLHLLELYDIVEELSSRANQPMPRLYVAPTQTPNAFATGRNPQNAAVCCTEGILQLLDEREMRGVLGHELMHVYNRDILTSSIAAGISTIIGTIANVVSFGAMFGGGNRHERGNPLGALAIAVLAPLASAVIQMAISRTREYDADEDGAALTNDPLALASALNKLESGVSLYPMDPDNPRTATTSSMMIANPFGNLNIGKFFSTHPPMDQRIARLQQMARDNGQYN